MRNNAGLSIYELFRAAPSVSATSGHPSRSAQYRPIASLDIVQGLKEEGFVPVEATQRGRGLYAKHLLRFRRLQDPVILGGIHREVLLINSYDGSSAFRLASGFFRLVCSNGLVTGNIETMRRILHKGDAVEQARVEALNLIERSKRSAETIEKMQSIKLDDEAAVAFARRAVDIRWAGNVPLDPNKLLMPRRIEDAGSDLWSVFNRVQENLVRGGIPSISSTGRRTRTRQITAIDQDIRINQELWNAAEALTV